MSGVVHLPVWRTLRRPDLLGYFACWVLIFAAFTMNMMNLPLAVTRELGGTNRDLGIIFGVGPVVEVPLMLWFGHLATRGQQVFLLRIGMAVTTLYFVLLLLAREPWHVVLHPVPQRHRVRNPRERRDRLLSGSPARSGWPGDDGIRNATQLGNLIGYLGFGALASGLEPRALFGAGAIAGAAAFLLFHLIHRAAPCSSGTPPNPVRRAMTAPDGRQGVIKAPVHGRGPGRRAECPAHRRPRTSSAAFLQC